MHDIRSSIVKIYRPGSDMKSFGTGFLVSKEQKLILTCAHVIAPKENQQKKNFQWPKEVKLAFLIEPSFKERTALIKSEFIFGYNEGDFAVLFLQDELPSGALPLKLTKSKGVYTIRLMSYGFPVNMSAKGTNGECQILKPAPDPENSEIEILQLSNANSLDAGFSGGPVVIPDTDQVVGMVRFIPVSARARQLDSAYAMSAEEITIRSGNVLPCQLYRLKKNVNFSDLKTYLLDREDQDFELRSVFKEKIREPGPLPPPKGTTPIQGVCLLHGTEDELPEQYIDRLQKHSIDVVFLKDPSVAEPYVVGFNWPNKYKSKDDFHERILYNLKSALGENTYLEKEQMAESVYSKKNGPIIFYTTYIRDVLDPKDVEEFFTFWSTWPKRKSNFREVVLSIMVVRYTNAPSCLLAPTQEDHLKTCVGDELCGVLFPPLSSVSKESFITWVKNQEDSLKELNLLQKMNNVFPAAANSLPLAKILNEIRQ